MSRKCLSHILLLVVTVLANGFSAGIALADEPVGSLQPVASHETVIVSLTESLTDAAVLAGGTPDGGTTPAPSCPCQSGGAGGSKCDCAKAKSLEKAVASAYKPLFYDNNFSYLCDPCHCDWHLGERLKRIGVGPCLTVDAGGEYRARLMNERNMRGLGLTGLDDDFLLHRTRLYVNTELGERVRVYAELLDAVSEFEQYPIRGIEENRTDLQNLFLDLVALDTEAGKLTVRYGRQELLYGSERLVSPLDWANARRTFEGAKLMWRGESWDLDGFWVQELRRVVDQLDPPNQDRPLYGVFSTYKGWERDKADLYWLALDLNDLGFRYDTIGGRYYGDRQDWLYELEGGVQFGQNADDSDHAAGFFTLGLGRKWDCAAWKPRLWAFYDWASGDDTVNNGFHHYEPLAHKYLGFMDLFGRRNIETVNLQLTVQPHEKVKLLLWYYYFWLQNGNDVPYSVVMTPYAGLTAGTGERDLGHEIDILATWTVTARLELLFGYSHFFAGQFYASLPPGQGYNGDADFFYTQCSVRF